MSTTFTYFLIYFSSNDKELFDNIDNSSIVFKLWETGEDKQ